MASLELIYLLRKCGRCGKKLRTKEIIQKFDIKNDGDLLRAIGRGISCPHCGKQIRKLIVTKETAEKHQVKSSRNISIR